MSMISECCVLSKEHRNQPKGTPSARAGTVRSTKSVMIACDYYEKIRYDTN